MHAHQELRRLYEAAGDTDALAALRRTVQRQRLRVYLRKASSIIPLLLSVLAVADLAIVDGAIDLEHITERLHHVLWFVVLASWIATFLLDRALRSD
jgi:hypothetical protein